MVRSKNVKVEAQWRERLARFRRSNMTVVEFCRREGVSDPSFYHWRKRLEQGHERRKQVQPQGARSRTTRRSNPFVPVQVSSPVLAEVEFRNGVRIRVPAAHAEALRVALMAGNELCQGGSSC